MPKVRRSRKPPPDGWELIEPTLEELEQKMREGETSVASFRDKHEQIFNLNTLGYYHILLKEWTF